MDVFIDLQNVIIGGLSTFHDVFNVTCRSTEQPHNNCGICKACLVNQQLHFSKEWWSRSGDLTRRRFLLALISRIRPELLEHLAQILKPFVESKDFTYARNKFLPSSVHDRFGTSGDRCLDPSKVHEDSVIILNWFKSQDKYTQCSFLLTILQWCEYHLIFAAAMTIISIQEIDSDDEDDVENGTSKSKRLVLSASSARNNIGTSILKNERLLRPKTASAADSRQKSVTNVSFASMNDSRLADEDSETEGFTSTTNTQLHVPKYKDFIRQLPIYLAKQILHLLDKKALNQCKLVTHYWKKLTIEIDDEILMKKLLLDDMMLLQSTVAHQCNPRFAHDTLVPVPDCYSQISIPKKDSEDASQTKGTKQVVWSNLYTQAGLPIRLVLMEERNIYCGSYNVLLLKDNRDHRRIVNMSGESMVAIASRDSRVRFIDMNTAQERPLVLVGHVASIHCIYMQESRKRIFTGSYDLTVRCWSLETGRCIKLFHGHERTVTCLSVYFDLIAAGGNDNCCLVWRYKRRRPWRTFKHKHPVTAVAINDDMTISGDVHGKIKLWHNLSGNLIKILKHRSCITSVKFDKWHIASASHDTYASLWSSQGNFKRPLCTFRHPKEVLCMEFAYLRLLTGCADGKIRIWSVLNAHCLRVMRGNSLSDPVVSLIATPNRILINTENSLLLMNFEQIDFDYNLKEDSASAMHLIQSENTKKLEPVRPYSVTRARRADSIHASSRRLFEDNTSTQPSHSTGLLNAKEFKRAKKAQTRPHPISSARSISTNKSRVRLDSRTTNTDIEEKYSNKKSTTNEQRSLSEQTGNVKILFDNVDVGLDLSLDETKELLKRQMRMGEGKLPEEFRTMVEFIRQSPYYRIHSSQDDNIYLEHNSLKQTISNRPPSSPSKIDTKVKLKQHQTQKRVEQLKIGFYKDDAEEEKRRQEYLQLEREENERKKEKLPVFGHYEIIYRRPAQMPRSNNEFERSMISFHRVNDNEEKRLRAQSARQPATQLPVPVKRQIHTSESENRQLSSLDSVAGIQLKTTSIHEKIVKHGRTTHTVIVGYVSPYTSPLRRDQLNLKTLEEVEQTIKQIKDIQQKTIPLKYSTIQT